VRGITRKKPRRVHAYIPNQIPKRKASTHHKKIAKKKLRKSQKRENGRDNMKP
jgi:hypothetical protein